MQVQPYLNFDGRCEEAIEFYRSAVGAEVTMLMRFKEMPACDEPSMVPPGCGEKIMHAGLKVGESTVLASDMMCGGEPQFRGVSLTILAADVAEAERFFAALSDGGKVNMPLSETFFSPSFGSLDDRFGLTWMIYTQS